MLISSSLGCTASHADDLLALSLEDLMQIQVVSSTLTEKNLRTVPSSVTVFTHAQINAMGIDYLDDLLNFVPGFQAFRQADSGGEYYHSSRGGRSGTSSREVLILIDGKRINAEFAAGSVHMIALKNFEKVEVIRGPGSAIYGSNAFLGVINITTIKNKDMLSLLAGSNNRTQAQLFKTAQLGEWNLDFFGNAYNDRGQAYVIEHADTRNPYQTRDPIDGYDLDVKLGNQKSQLSATYFKRNAQDFYLSEKTSNEFNESEVSDTSIHFQQILDWAADIRTDYSLRYHQRSSYLQLPLIPPSVDATFKEAAYEFNLHNNWLINDTHSVQFGLENRHIDSEAVNLNIGISKLLITEDYQRDVVGLYVQNQNSFGKNTELTLGARYDYYSKIGAAFNPRLGLTHQVSDFQTVKLLYGKAFRAPGIGDLTLTSNSDLVGNPDLNPEIIATWELVWMGNWKKNNLTITAFDNLVEDSIVQGFDKDGITRMYVNAKDSQRSRGVEFEYVAQINSNWQVRSQYSVFNKLPETAFRQADTIASFIVNYERQPWNLNFSANYAAERKMILGTNFIELDPYWLLNGKLQYLFHNN
ncbi:MAG TPA: TonB-dependent receptor, partial [Cellvibrio sp.]|nr:TonB-dependent receptor [Cellvibrio sp.]